MLDITVEDFRILIGERFSIEFQRTLKIPDDGKIYPLPPGLGVFPVYRVADYLNRVPDHWKKPNSFFIPMYQREALWLGFNGRYWKPNAVKIGVGQINAVSGEAWDEYLQDNPQDYLVCPNQPWLDGINVGEGFIRQFVAVPLGLGDTIEAQVTGVEEFGGIQILVYEPKLGKFPDQPPPISDNYDDIILESTSMTPAVDSEMGLGAGGKMKQKIYPDEYGIDTWDLENYGSISVYIVNSEKYQEITGLEPPPTPIDVQTYTQYGLPWFSLYDEEKGDLPASARLAEVKTIGKREAERGVKLDTDDLSVDVSEFNIKNIDLF
ncbi:hypothetical protein [Gloeothece verrucosa]|uniref:Integral membrane protein n=1 Tax=Gloeothece verrucosa (strain PCC 7822) TaxID=497965 RepID=E0UF71_GLOV7|nr:hypothetical protein [Gloeothece verrucosa]ADN15442.1 integral membrane protein [Gloeothece verrucosa PCC 7822]